MEGQSAQGLGTGVGVGEGGLARGPRGWVVGCGLWTQTETDRQKKNCVREGCCSPAAAEGWHRFRRTHSPAHSLLGKGMGASMPGSRWGGTAPVRRSVARKHEGGATGAIRVIKE